MEIKILLLVFCLCLGATARKTSRPKFRPHLFGRRFDRPLQAAGEGRRSSRLSNDHDWSAGDGARYKYSYDLQKNDGLVISLDDEEFVLAVDCSVDDLLGVEFGENGQGSEWTVGDFVVLGDQWECSFHNGRPAQQIREITDIAVIDRTNVLLATKESSFRQIFSSGRLHLNYDPPRQRNRDESQPEGNELLSSVDFSQAGAWNYNTVYDIIEETSLVIDEDTGFVCVNCYYVFDLSIEFILDFDVTGVNQLKLMVAGDLVFSLALGVQRFTFAKRFKNKALRNDTKFASIPLDGGAMALNLDLEFGADVLSGVYGSFDGYIQSPGIVFHATANMGFDYVDGEEVETVFDVDSEYQTTPGGYNIAQAILSVDAGLRLNLSFVINALDVANFRAVIALTPTLIADFYYPGKEDVCERDDITGTAASKALSIDISSTLLGSFDIPYILEIDIYVKKLKLDAFPFLPYWSTIMERTPLFDIGCFVIDITKTIAIPPDVSGICDVEVISSQSPDPSGYFTVIGIRENKPLYTNRNRDKFIYWLQDTERWVIGPEIGVPVGLVYSRDDVSDANSASTWSETLQIHCFSGCDSGGDKCCHEDFYLCESGEGSCYEDGGCSEDFSCGYENCVGEGFDITDRCCELGCFGEDGCCGTNGYLCDVNEGDCDFSSECRPGLTCGDDNCNGYWFDGDDDCCEDGCFGGEGCCEVGRYLCRAGEGDCDFHYQCRAGLSCGNANCHGDGFGSTDDCCEAGCFGADDCCDADRYLCGVGEGDCDSDDECQGDLKCGDANCDGPGFDGIDDCCEDGCFGGESCCNSDYKCGVGEGDCDFHSDCQSGLSCGTYNCVGSSFDSIDSCCERGCFGTDDCCDEDRYQCGVGEGDCDNDDDCRGDLKCGDANCDGPGFDSIDDCCEEGCQGGDSCCGSDGYKCGIGEGDCDDHSDCLSGLSCGEYNCVGSSFGNTDSCCERGCYGADDCCDEDRYKCGVGEGDCDNNDECSGNLICGSNNCVGSHFGGSDDCCQVGCGGGDSCCGSGGYKCGIGEGDCDWDSDCAGDLECGNNNCDWGDNDDCCEEDKLKRTLPETIFGGTIGIFGLAAAAIVFMRRRRKAYQKVATTTEVTAGDLE